MLASARLAVVTGASDINSEPSYSRATGPDMTPSSLLNQTMVLGGRTGILKQHAPWGAIS